MEANKIAYGTKSIILDNEAEANKYELMSDGIVAESKNLLTNELDKTNI